MPPAFVLSQNQTLQTENLIWTEVHFYLVQKSLTCFSIVVFLTKYFASSHYFDHYDRNSFINGLIALFKFSRNTQTQKPADNSFLQLNHKRIIRWSNHRLFYMLSVQRIPSETHLRQAAEFVFSFWMINMLCFAWSLNISHFFALSSRISNFFRIFFSTCVIRKTFLRRASCFIALSKCSFKNSSSFWNFLRRTSCFPASLKTYCSFGFNRNCTLFRFHHSLFPTEYIFFNQHRCYFCHHALNIPPIFHLSNIFSKKIEKKLTSSWKMVVFRLFYHVILKYSAKIAFKRVILSGWIYSVSLPSTRKT